MANLSSPLKIVDIEAKPIGKPASKAGISGLPAPKRVAMEILPMVPPLEDPVVPHNSDELFAASMQGLLTLRKDKQIERFRARCKWLLSWMLILYATGLAIYYSARFIPWQDWLDPVLKRIRELPIF
jgi:hypothetical protein